MAEHGGTKPEVLQTLRDMLNLSLDTEPRLVLGRQTSPPSIQEALRILDPDSQEP